MSMIEKVKEGFLKFSLRIAGCIIYLRDKFAEFYHANEKLVVTCIVLIGLGLLTWGIIMLSKANRKSEDNSTNADRLYYFPQSSKNLITSQSVINTLHVLA